jgi:hypothetical protein
MLQFEAFRPIAMLSVREYDAVARLAQRPQPAHDIFDPRLYHFRILSILCQRAIAFDHRNQ